MYYEATIKLKIFITNVVLNSNHKGKLIVGGYFYPCVFLDLIFRLNFHQTFPNCFLVRAEKN